MPHSSRNQDSPARRERRRRTHQRIDSNGDLAPRPRRRDEQDSAPSSPSKSRPKKCQHGGRRSSRAAHSEYSRSASTALSSAQLAQLDKFNQKQGWSEYDGIHRQRVDDDETHAEYDNDREREQEEREMERERRRQEHRERKRRRREEERREEATAATEEEEEYNSKYKRYRRNEGRSVSGQALERGSHYYGEKEKYRSHMRGGKGSSESDYDEEARRRKRKRNICIGAAVLVLILIIVIPVGVVVTKKGSSDSSGGAVTSSAPDNANLNSIDPSSIPKSAQGTYLDPFSWYDTTDFNVTYTDATVGGLYTMGLNSTWDDTTKANDNVPPLNEKWNYGTMRFRGVNLGGWLSIEPFITPSLFEEFDSADGVVDEWTLSETLGPDQAKETLEQHYSAWVQESTFAEIQAAGFDHLRIPFSYWAVTTYNGDPYVPLVSWRYLLRGIEWARKYGLRVNLDLHGAPGSQNGWSHSGHQGAIGWLNGTDGALNGQRTIDLHKQLSTFFTQPRYKNIITMYGLVNEPKMIALNQQTVMTWSQNAITTIRGNGYSGLLIIGDGFMGLENWQGQMQGIDGLVLDAHQYVIFNVEQITLPHRDKIDFACGGWTQQSRQSMNTATGFGPTMFGEWSQADTDCAEYLNNVGTGSRWEGTLNMAGTPGGATSGSVLTPTCPTHNDPRCSCDEANANPSSYSDEYKQWLKMFAEAQMDSFEEGWGWFYWTWQTESAPQWSYKDALSNGIVPDLVYQRDWSCNQSIPDYASSGLPEFY